MTVIIATPHGFEAVEAVVQYESRSQFRRVFGDRYERAFGGDANPGLIPYGHYLVRHLDNTLSVHDTDPRIEPTYPEWSWGWADKDEPALVARVHKTRDAALGEMRGRIAPVKLLTKPRYPVTLAGKPFTLVGEWVEVEDA